MKTALIIPVYNNPQITERCLGSIFRSRQNSPEFNAVVIDDGSDGKTKDTLKHYPVKVLTNSKNRGYLYSTNRGIRYALNNLRAEKVVLMNNDVEVRGRWLENLLQAASQYDVVGYHGRMNMKQRKSRKAFFLEFSTVLIKSKVFRKIGFLDKRLISGYYSDDDFCLRALLAGYKIGQLHQGKPPFVIHRGRQTFRSKSEKFKRIEYRAFVKKWAGNDAELVKDYLANYTFNPDTQSWGILEPK